MRNVRLHPKRFMKPEIYQPGRAFSTALTISNPRAGTFTRILVTLESAAHPRHQEQQSAASRGDLQALDRVALTANGYQFLGRRDRLANSASKTFWHQILPCFSSILPCVSSPQEHFEVPPVSVARNRGSRPQLLVQQSEEVFMRSGPPQPPERLDWNSHAIFLDFDGTLVALADRPELVCLTTGTRELLTRLSRATDGATAVISGRSLSDLEANLAHLHLTLVGSHGLEFRAAEGKVLQSSEYTGPLVEAANALSPLAAEFNLLMERKPGAVAVHYRDRPEVGSRVRHSVSSIASMLGLKSMNGHMVSEITPQGINKGTSIMHLMKRAPFSGRVPVMIGDDTTDEDGFEMAQSIGGFGARIGGDRTCAKYQFKDRPSALSWLAASL
ncbi:trehalose-phosphatase [Salipiger sp. PrR003]|uniref:trehalose-phosphatase n=1 Tax=Salipiger sp. PrR003 TaxID=2706776 RepID=UPI0013DB28CA|nr:trehalose-phosphatase [Salipiger sp. PrR003]NDV49305.1 trehalose-phosphatase [Salipiger sp. PrR003]